MAQIAPLCPAGAGSVTRAMRSVHPGYTALGCDSRGFRHQYRQVICLVQLYGRMANLWRMIRDAPCSTDYSGITPEDSNCGVYKLPHITHYDSAFEMDKVVHCLKTTIEKTLYTAPVHTRTFLYHAFERPVGTGHQVFSPISPSGQVACTHSQQDSSRLPSKQCISLDLDLDWPQTPC